MFKPLLQAIQTQIRTKLVLGYVGATVTTLILTMLSASIANVIAFTNDFASPEQLQEGSKAYVPALTALASNDRGRFKEAIQKTMDAVRKEQQANLPNGLRLDLELAYVDASNRVVACSPPSAFQKGSAYVSRNMVSESGPKTTFFGGVLYKSSQTSLQVRDLEGVQQGVLVIHAKGSLGPIFFRDGALTFLPLAGAVLAVGLCVAYGVGKLVSNQLLRRLEGVFGALEEWRMGRFHKLAPVTPRDELGLLGMKLNDLAVALEGHFIERSRRARDMERERVERDLHDTVKQQTFAASLQLAIALKQLDRGEEARPVIEQARSLIESARKDLAEMFPSTDSEPSRTSLSDALRARGNVWMEGARMNLKVDLQESFSVAETYVPDLLRIIDEALANVVRHSKATHVNVSLKRDGDRGSLTVVDDGIGFDPTRIQAGRGLKNIYDRAITLPGGSSKVLSSPTNGTTLEVRWDLNG